MSINKKMLTEKPVVVRISVPSNQDNELVMFADNLGSIPPNTALMILYDGKQRTDVRINSDTQKSGTIILKRVE